ncbi:MAG: VapC toxin family PIN domain ribonuclease [Gammaproteobacteria bacterium HGW-Gammaproteobacteria-8]|nr:MAG: VapC toxin family PIN domain ribonuclease [Gammaproteobacteria bacterium HGW-Gammaproteobacteria-8]
MSRYLIDTDVLIDFLRGHSAAVAWLNACQQPPMIAVITVAELHAGMREGEEAALDALIESFDMVEIDAAIARRGGDLRRRFGPSHGTGLADALIAACAQSVNASLVTLNTRHFPMMERLVAPYAR